MEEPVIKVRNLSKRYFIGKTRDHKEKHSLASALLYPYRMLKGLKLPFQESNEKAFWALKEINLDVYHGEKIGIIGRNGAGKSTFLKILSRLVYPTEGEARIRGRVTSLLEVGTGFNPNLTGRENIYLNASLHGMERAEVNEKFNAIVEFSGVAEFIDTPVKYYSSGMYIRLAFSVAAHIDPDILLLDEVLTVGDMAFQQKCLQRVEGLASGGRTIIFVSHSMGDIVKFCEKALWLEKGRIVEFGDTKTIVNSYAKSVTKLKSSYHAPLPKPDAGSMEAARPDSPAVELLSFEISDDSGKTKEVFFRNEPIHASVTFRVLRDDMPLVVNLHLHKDGTHVFTTHCNKPVNWQQTSVYCAKTVITPNMLNTGDFNFSVAIVTPTRPIIRHIKLDHILSIKIVEEYDSNRIFSGEYRGVVRPFFPWDISPVKKPAALK